MKYLRRVEIFIKDKYDNIIHSEATAICNSLVPIEEEAAVLLFNNRHKILENPGSKAELRYIDESGYVWKCNEMFNGGDLNRLSPSTQYKYNIVKDDYVHPQF